MTLMPHGATNVYVRQLQTLLSPEERVPEDFVNVWMWWFNLPRPDQEGMWVPHLSWTHRVIATPTERQPVPSAGGRKRAMPLLRANALSIPPYNDLAAWESRRTPERGRNFRDIVERYAEGPETSHARPPGRDAPSTVVLVVLENSNYYHVMISPLPQEWR